MLLEGGKANGSPIEYFGAIDSVTNNWSEAENKLIDIGFTVTQVDEFLGFTSNYEELDFFAKRKLFES